MMIWSGIAVISLFYVICIVYNTVLCVPHHGDSGWVAVQARCGQPELQLSAAQGVFSTLSDLYVLCIPVYLVGGLHMPLGRKLGVIGVFLTGLM
jgi:hypothetical protein